MVEAEEALEAVGVGLVALQLGDEVELAAEEVLVPAAEVDVGVGDVASEHRLLDGEVDGARLDLAERGGHAGDLVPGLHLDRLHLGDDDVLARRGVEDLAHGRGQPRAGHVLGLVA